MASTYVRYGGAALVVACAGGVIYKQQVDLHALQKRAKVLDDDTSMLRNKLEDMKKEHQTNMEVSKALYSKLLEKVTKLGENTQKYEKLKQIAPTLYREAIEREITPFHDTMIKFGLPSEENLHFYSSFISSTNYQKRIPNWVMQHITSDDMADDNVNADRKHSQFTGDVPHVPVEFQANNKDYFKSGWSRGHMVPAGDNRRSQEAMDDTFHLNNNIVPQNLHNNMHFWYRLEVFAKNTMTRQFDDVYVISGPVFIPTTSEEDSKKYIKYEVLGENNVAVPSHLFKVILVIPKYKKKKEEHLLGAFLVPNERINDNKVLTDFEVPLEYLEKHTGLKFFRNLNRQTDIKPLCAYTACQVMTEAQLTQWNYARRIDWSKTKKEAEETWEEYQSKGYAIDERIRAAYDRKLSEFKNTANEQK